MANDAGSFSSVVLTNDILIGYVSTSDSQRRRAWTNTSYMPTEWETAKRRLTYYSSYWPNQLYSLKAVK